MRMAFITITSLAANLFLTVYIGKHLVVSGRGIDAFFAGPEAG
jgi:hypothetical protein